MERIIDIYSKGEYPANALSNFQPYPFTIDGVACGGMEGFLQSLKFRSAAKQKQVCALYGKAAKAVGTKKFLWKWTGTVHWQGKRLKRDGEELRALVLRAYEEMYKQNEAFRTALTAAEGAKLCHTMGGQDSKRTILTEAEFVSALEHLLTLKGGK